MPTDPDARNRTTVPSSVLLLFAGSFRYRLYSITAVHMHLGLHQRIVQPWSPYIAMSTVPCPACICCVSTHARAHANLAPQRPFLVSDASALLRLRLHASASASASASTPRLGLASELLRRSVARLIGRPAVERRRAAPLASRWRACTRARGRCTRQHVNASVERKGAARMSSARGGEGVGAHPAARRLEPPSPTRPPLAEAAEPAPIRRRGSNGAGLKPAPPQRK